MLATVKAITEIIRYLPDSEPYKNLDADIDCVLDMKRELRKAEAMMGNLNAEKMYNYTVGTLPFNMTIDYTPENAFQARLFLRFSSLFFSEVHNDKKVTASPIFHQIYCTKYQVGIFTPRKAQAFTFFLGLLLGIYIMQNTMVGWRRGVGLDGHWGKKEKLRFKERRRKLHEKRGKRP